MTEFQELFPEDIPPIGQDPEPLSAEQEDLYHRIELINPTMTLNGRDYRCPQKYLDPWKKLFDQHMKAGRIRFSNSPYASPAFIVPKKDPIALPRWVNDYRLLNDNTVKDRTTPPNIDDVLACAGNAKYWAKLDMTNSFFQTRVHPDHIKYTAVRTPFGLVEWPVMPMGLTNAPATHQRRMNRALQGLIGKICFVYLDDIIIWSDSLEEHRKNVKLVLEALKAAGLYASPGKSELCLDRVEFLGHVIDRDGIHPDPKKVEKILAWPTPRSATHVRQFNGLTHYLAKFLPHLADQMLILTPLTTDEAEKNFIWGESHQAAFIEIKRIVTTAPCLTTIDFKDPEQKIFVHCDASKYAVGCQLSVGKDWRSARPVAFESKQLNPAQQRYPTHERELFAIIHALRKWRVYLLGTHFEIYTDHDTLLNLKTQPELSHRQARWVEFLSQYDYEMFYIKGEDNTVADALSRFPYDQAPEFVRIQSFGTIAMDSKTIDDWISAYDKDKFSQMLLTNADSVPTLSQRDRLLYLGERLVVPNSNKIRESLLQVAHDAMGHFGFDKVYGMLRSSYYWPNMRKDVETYLATCDPCQRHKSSTRRPPGPLHPLPIPDSRFYSVGTDLIGPLPECDGYNGIITFTDRKGGLCRVVPCRMDQEASDFADIFHDEWYCHFGLPGELVSDRDHLFISKAWKSFTKRVGIDLKMSTSFHPETDGISERSNKTVIQALRYHVDRRQSNWVRGLRTLEFKINNTINASTGKTPFQVSYGRSPRVIPSFHKEIASDIDSPAADAIIQRIQLEEQDAEDALIATKVRQAAYANEHRGPAQNFEEGQLVMVSTENRRREYKNKGQKRAAKFFPRWDGPYKIIQAFPDTSTYKVELPPSSKQHPVFHERLLKIYHANDESLFPGRVVPKPPPIIGVDGHEEWVIERIIDERTTHRGKRRSFLVRWQGYGPEGDTWEPLGNVEDSEALDRWEEEVRAEDAR